RCASRLQAAISSALGTCGNATIGVATINTVAKNIAARHRMTNVILLPPQRYGLPRFSDRPARRLARESCAAQGLRSSAGPCARLARLTRRRGDRLQRLMRLGRPHIRATDDISHRHDAHESLLLIDDRDAPDLVLTHQLGGLIDRILR